MKRFLQSVLLSATVSAFTVGLSARVVNSPAFEARASSIITIDEISLDKDATRVKCHAVFRPHWWISVDSAVCLSDPETGEEYLPTATEGLTFGEKIWMPASGDSVFTIIYPPLPESVRKVDFDPDNGFATYGIDLTGKKRIPIVRNKPVRSQRKLLPSYFTPGKVRVHGKIEGYDRRLGFENFVIYTSDLPLGISSTNTIEITPEGAFDSSIDLTSAQSVIVNLGSGFYMPLYLEPDNDIYLDIDFEDILHFDRMRGLKDKVDNIGFGGSLGEINEAIYLAPEWKGVDPFIMADKMTPDEACKAIAEDATDYKARMESYKDSRQLSETSRRLLDNMVFCSEAAKMLDFDFYRRDLRWQYPDSAELQQPLPEDFFESFMPEFLKADTSVLAIPEMHFTLNRLGYSTIPMSFGIEPDSASFDYQTDRATTELMKRLSATDDVPFIWQTAVSAMTGYWIAEYARWNHDRVKKQLDKVTSEIVTDPYLRQRLEDIFKARTEIEPYDIPETAGGLKMKELLAPYAGKWVLVDFWATTCGPCRANISSMKAFRDANRDNSAFTFLFVTGDYESPEEDFKTFAAENLTHDNVVRMPQADMMRLRDLFGINGIPHYVLVNPEGRVADDKFAIYMLQSFLNQESVEYAKP